MKNQKTTSKDNEYFAFESTHFSKGKKEFTETLVLRLDRREALRVAAELLEQLNRSSLLKEKDGNQIECSIWFENSGVLKIENTETGIEGGKILREEMK